MTTITPPTILVLFGATGDLARLKILPALRELWISGQLSRNFKLITVGRREMSTEEYVKYLAEIAPHPFTHDLSILGMEYVCVDFDVEDGFNPLRQIMEKYRGAHVLYYMSVGPDVLELSIDQFSQPDYRRTINSAQSAIIVEKPFGENLADARELNRKLQSIFGVRNIFRNDHYLNKATVQAIVPIRETDPEMQKLLTKDELGEVQIVVAEKVDVGTRAGYFDGRGMVIDWMQSHMLQVLATLFADLGDDNFGLSKAEFIDSLSLVPHSLIRAQYAGYSDIQGVNPELETETFFATQFTSDIKKWQGVTFSLIAGKAMAEKEVMINLRLRHEHPKLGNTIKLYIDPSGGHALLDNQASGDEYQLTIMQAIRDEWDKFVSQQEVEAQWRITEKVRAAFKEIPLEYYVKGTSYKHFCTETWCISV